MIEIEELKLALEKAANYFESRRFNVWASDARESILQLNKGDLKVIENLSLKYAPTCEIEELFITEYERENEPKVVALNNGLAEIINSTYLAIERAQYANT